MMEQEVMQRRTLLFDLLYRKATAVYIACVPKPVQWVMEVALLLMASGMLVLWAYVHFTYIINADDCLEQITDRPFPYDVILQVETFTNTSRLWRKRELAVIELYESISEHHRPSPLTPERDEWDEVMLGSERWKNTWGDDLSQFLGPVLGSEEEEGERWTGRAGSSWLPRDNQHPSTSQSKRHESPEQTSDTEEALLTATDRKNSLESDENEFPGSEGEPSWSASGDLARFAESRTLYELFDFYSLKFLSVDYTILEFSQEPGYLSLTHSSRNRLNISVEKIYVDPENITCFGGPFGKFLTKFFLGYEMMIIASFKNLLPPGQGSGYVKNLMTGNQYYYRVQWMGKWRYGAGLLPAMFFTLVASVLLRQVHYHVFKFLTHFQHLLNQGVPMPIQTGAQIPFLIITYAAIGLIIVMSEALSDDSVFSLLMVATVWETDQFYAVFCKQDASKKFFPWFFYLYHFIPYAYYIRFNGQFWLVPFIFHWLLLQHAMLLFFHHCELPAVTVIHQARQQPPAAPQAHLAEAQPRIHVHPEEMLRVQPPRQAEPEGVANVHAELSDNEEDLVQRDTQHFLDVRSGLRRRTVRDGTVLHGSHSPQNYVEPLLVNTVLDTSSHTEEASAQSLDSEFPLQASTEESSNVGMSALVFGSTGTHLPHQRSPLGRASTASSGQNIEENFSITYGSETVHTSDSVQSEEDNQFNAPYPTQEQLRRIRLNKFERTDMHS